MPCVRKSTLSSALAAATATLSAINSATTVSPLSSATASVVDTTSAVPTLSSSIVVAASSSVASSAAAASSTATATSTSGNTTYAGVNIAGFDFGCSTDGTCTVDGITVPSTGAEQMQHFYSADNLNIFRITVGWQYLTNAVVGGDLDATNFAQYDNLMQSCLATGAKCILDIHNYARWDGEIIGQGGPTNDEFAALWTSLATEYANNTNVFFGIMNEPHDLTVSTWAETVQAVVTAIRAVAPDHTLLLPGSSYSSAETLPTEAGPYLLNVTNPDGSTDNLLFDVHKYLDSDNSGTSTECVTNNVDDAFSPLATWLRENNRQAILSETGGGNTASCETYLCQEVAYLNENSDVYLGYVGWAAGAFDSTYALTLTPTGTTAADMVDTALMSACIAR
ncbi:family 5 glycoside hydrolase [Cryphonectria parasitica EP155]|uniref:Endoglucanase EG-II n=1 Tax=Cryphonectria parasitica (strain ATCC 38755 / EP155) TaxID=660469 RepID=A0A9P5CN18_CRYP1|nr:family 5 glycoside hydrolase [Cryphonectria parasitica EP155]KAF3763847.1 family 5 glycoside hydrolase [Cryphonectria parasitica EP155]